MKTIIVPTDFSPTATNAMNYAMDMAQEIDASLLLFHVYQVPIAITDVPMVLVSVDELREGAESKLAELKKNVEHLSFGKLKVYTEARLGDVTDELQSVCEKVNPFAVVMGTTGLSAVERTIFGSTTLSALRHLSCPVICVPKGKEYGNGVRKIGLACDFREVVESTPFNKILTVVNEFKAEFHVLNVDHDNHQFRPDTPQQSVLLHTAFEKLNPTYHFIEHKDIEDGINEFAEKNNLDLIITIPKKHSFLESLFRKSSTRQLVFESHVPVLCVHEE